MGACKHHVVPAQGKGRQQQKHQALLHIRKADTALSRRVIDSCLHFLHREKPPTASQHQSQPWPSSQDKRWPWQKPQMSIQPPAHRYRLTMTPLDVCNSGSKRGFYRAFPHNCSFWGCTEVWMNRAHSSQFASQLQHPLWAPTCPGFTTQPQLLMVPFLHRRARTRHSWNSWNPQKQGTKALHKPNRPHVLAAKGCQTDPTASQTIIPNPPSLIVQLFHLIKFKFLAPGIESTDFSLEAYHHTSWQPSSG